MIPEDDVSPGSSEFDQVDPVLAEWAAELADRIRAGDPVDQESLAAQHPEHAEQLRQLLPTIRMMAALMVPDTSERGGPGSVRPEVGADEAPRHPGEL